MFPSCMSLLPRRNEPRPARPGQAPVVLNVYDMYWTNCRGNRNGLGLRKQGRCKLRQSVAGYVSRLRAHQRRSQPESERVAVTEYG
ncbi:jg2427 [Pararge aegeria aegeria]|uniref:Jg2427 protein n=1 Tax=Pararge aegeria aegeria TaxID=348720 RepID=A0A8S4QA81_9NEOP|nr:jg2427 [Pararge aegeria aegeria]